MRGMVAYKSHFPQENLPIQAVLSIMPGSVLIKLEDTDLRRRLVCSLKVKAMLTHSRRSKVTVVLDGTTASGWQEREVSERWGDAIQPHPRIVIRATPGIVQLLLV